MENGQKSFTYAGTLGLVHMSECWKLALFCRLFLCLNANFFFIPGQETFWGWWKESQLKNFPPSGRMVSSHLCWQSDATMEKSNWKKSHRWDFPALLQYHTSSWNKSLHHWWELPSNASLSKINFSSFSAQWPTDRFRFWRWRWGRGLRGLLMKKEKLCCVSLIS